MHITVVTEGAIPKVDRKEQKLRVNRSSVIAWFTLGPGYRMTRQRAAVRGDADSGQHHDMTATTLATTIRDGVS